MSAITAKVESTAVARPLHVLLPLIKKDYEQGDSAAGKAAMPYVNAAALKLWEARGHFTDLTEFFAWAHRNVKSSREQLKLHLALGEALAGGKSYESLEDFKRRGLGRKPSVPGSQRDKDWREPIKATLGKVDVEVLNLRRAEIARVEERDAERQLGRQLIDIGFRALATKLHPDKGGSRDAMQRLGRVRARLRKAV